MANNRIAGLAGIGLGLVIAAGCTPIRHNAYQGFDNIEPDLGTIPQGENPMPAAVAPVPAGEVVYPTAQPPKTPEYWQQHENPYEGMTQSAQPSKTKVSPGTIAGYDTYIVKGGDTFGGIAAKKGVPLKSLKSANPGIDYNRIKVGQKIAIPASAAKPDKVQPANQPGVHVVKQGEILGRIARQYGVKLADLKAANNLTGDKIFVGQKLRIPGKGAAEPVAAKKSGGAQDATIAAPVTVEQKRPAVQPAKVEPVQVPAFDIPVPEVKAEPVPEVKPVATPVAVPEFGIQPIAAPKADSQTTTYLASGNEDIYTIAINSTLSLADILRLNPQYSDNPSQKPPAGTPILIPVK